MPEQPSTPAQEELEALRREKEALRAALERAERLLDLGDGFIEFDGDFRYRDMNAPAERMHGRSLEELRGKSLWEEYPRLLGTELERLYQRVVAERIPMAFEHFDSFRGRWYEVRVVPSEAGGLYALYRDITPLKEAEQERERAARERATLLEREQAARAEAEQERSRLFSVFEQAPAIITLSQGPEHRFVLANPQARRLFNRDVVGKPFRQALPELEGQGYIERLDQVYSRGETYHGWESPAWMDRGGDGTLEESFFNFIYQPWREASGKIIGVMAFAFEVTEQVWARRRVEELARAEELGRWQLEAIIESMDEGLIISNPAGHILSMNPAALRIHDFEDVRQARRHLKEYPHAFALFDLDHQPVPLESWPLSRALRGEHFSGYSVRVRRQDTGREWVGSYGGTPVRNREGELLFVILTLRDITETMRAEEALRESELRYRSLVAASASIVWTTGPQGRFVTPQHSWEEYTGQPWEEHRGYGWEQALHPEDRRTTRALWRKAIAERSLYENEGRLWSARHQQYRYFSARAAPVLNPDGSVREWIGWVRDVHERKSAQEASRLKSEFLANMSHELRTPLNAIIGFSEMLHASKLGPLNARQLEFLGDIVTSGRHLLALINDVLDLSKIEAGKMEFHPEAVELKALAQGVVDILRELATSKRIRVELDISSELGVLVLDPARLKQVLYNYLSNALKFTPEEGRVVLRARPEGDKHFLLEVEDTGVGIHPEDLGRLFSAFQQLDSGPAKRYAGTGLGLALTQRIVTGQGGRVGVRSTPGVGSVFFAVLPRVTSPVEQPAAAVGPLLGPRRETPHLLVIEDEERERSWLVRTLTSAGYAVTAASTGQAGLTLARQRRFDAITLDVMLPDMNGLEVGRQIRAAGACRETPIVIVTVLHEQRAAVGFAVHDVLLKPVAAEHLLVSLSRAGVRTHSGRRVLVVDDDPQVFRRVEGALRAQGLEPEYRADALSGLQAVEQHQPAAIILDLLMPELDGFAFLERLRAEPWGQSVPVLVWTVKELTAEERQRLQVSAQHVIVKEPGEKGLLAALREVVEEPPALA